MDTRTIEMVVIAVLVVGFLGFGVIAWVGTRPTHSDRQLVCTSTRNAIECVDTVSGRTVRVSVEE